MSYLRPFSMSIIFHLVLFYLFLSGSGAGGDSQSNKNHGSSQKQDNIKITMKEPDQKTQKTQQEIRKGKVSMKIKKKKKVKKKPIDCKDYYEGIGVRTDHASCLVSEVFRGYAADKAGMMAGDLIVSPDCSDLRGKEGSTIIIKVMRGVEVKTFNIIRERICGERSEKP